MIKKCIPNMLTLSNLSLGILSIIEVMNKNYFMAAVFIIAAAFVDRYDGKAARAFNVSSEIGKQLDSLSDLVSFGVAPAILVLFRYDLNSSLICLGIMIFYILCGCYRLARYNVSIFEGEFCGVPITICGIVLAVLSFININTKVMPAVIMILFGYLMVSKLKLKKI